MDHGPSDHAVLFVQGGGDGAHAFDESLVRSLRSALGTGYTVRYPQMPNEGDPNPASWGPAVREALERTGPGAFVVAHSVGATILANLLARDPDPTLAGVFLVAAPYVGQGGWPSGDIPDMADLGTLLQHEIPVFLYHGTDDATAPVAHLDLYARAIPHAVVRRIPGVDHQVNGDLSIVAADIRSLMRART